MRTTGGAVRSLVQIVAIAVGLATFVMGATFAVNAVAFSRGQGDVIATLQRSIADGSINATRPLSPLRFLTFRFGERSGSSLFAHDCLIWTTLIAPGLDAKALTMRTIRIEAAKRDIDPRAPANPDCQAVVQILQPDRSAQAQPTNVPYDRYIMGQRVLAQLLLSHLSLSVSAAIVQMTVYLAFFVALALAWRRRATAVVAICTALLLFYGLTYYGGMLYFAPMDVTHAAFIIAALLVPPGTAPMTVCAVFGALYGAFVAQFEILTGGIPVALALIALLVGISSPDWRTLLRNVSVIVAAFCVAFVCCFAIRLALVSLIEGTNQFARHMPSLFRRLRGDIALETPPGLIKLFVQDQDYPFGQLIYLIQIYRYWSRLIGWGSSTLGSLLVVSSLVALVFATIRTGRSSSRADFHVPPQLVGCWLALGVLIAWVSAFWNHTLVHPFFMARMLVIPVMCGAVAIVAVRAELRRRPQAQSAG
jgi:hypothetical protein